MDVWLLRMYCTVLGILDVLVTQSALYLRIRDAPSGCLTVENVLHCVVDTVPVTQSTLYLRMWDTPSGCLTVENVLWCVVYTGCSSDTEYTILTNERYSQWMSGC